MANHRGVLEGSVESFLGRYATTVAGGAISPTTDGRTVAAVIAGSFNPTMRAGGGVAKSAVSMRAPLVTASFTKTVPREHKDFFDFSATQLNARRKEGRRDGDPGSWPALAGP